MGRAHGAGMTRSRSQRAHALLAGALAAALLFAGCMDFVFPRAPHDDLGESDGLLRVWIATAPGAIGREFVGYNVSFGALAVAADIYLTNIIPIESRLATVDLVRMERDKLSAPLAEAVLPQGQYYAVLAQLSRVTVSVERIVGTANGVPVMQADERPILHNQRISEYRANIYVVGGRTTDVFLEVDVPRSLQRGEGGELHHTTILARITTLVDGNLASRMTYDGGRARIDPNDPRYADLMREREIPLSEPPIVDFRVYDAQTDARLYTNLPGFPSKRLNHAVGLEQELRFDASGSVSSYRRGAERVPIVEIIWTFGDGTTVRGARVTKAFESGGIYDVVVTVRDEVNLVASDHLTIFVPYTADQALAGDQDAAGGTLLLPTAVDGVPALDDTARLRFVFPAELEDGHLRLGGYRVSAVARDPLGGAWAGLLDVSLRIESGHFQATASGTGPWEFETAAVPAWRGPLSQWVADELLVNLRLDAGLAVQYEVVVEPLYYHNLSRGRDQHATHIHSAWTLGPIFEHLDWDGRVREAD